MTGLMGRKLEPGYRIRLLRDPEGFVRVIVGVEGDLAVRSAELTKAGLTVYRRLGLLNALAAGAPGRQILALCEKTWVSWVEEDREVRVAR